MNPFAIAGCLIAFNSLFFGFFVLAKNRYRRLNQLWFAFATSVALWGVGSTWIAIETNPDRALLAWRLSFAFSVVWIPILFFHFVCLFCELKRPAGLAFSYGIGLFFFPLILMSDFFFSDVRPIFSSFYYAQPGFLLVSFFTLLWLGLTFYSHALLFQAFHRTSDIKRTQIQYFFLATAIGYTGGSMEFLPIFGFDLYPWGHYAIALYPLIMGYAIIRYRLMDISIAIEKGLAYLALFLIAAIPAYGFLLWAQTTYFGSMSYPFSASLLVMFLLIGFGSYSLKIRAEDAVGRTLFKKRYETFQTISKFSKSLVTMLDFKTLTDEIVQTLVQVLSVRHVSLYVLDDGKSSFCLVSTAGAGIPPSQPRKIAAGEDLPRWFLKFPIPLVREELELSTRNGGQTSLVANQLHYLGTDMCLPFLNNKGRLLGFCALGNRAHSEMYSQEELNLLTSFSQNAAIALDNAMMYEELKKSYTLMQRTQRLRSLEIMAGGFAHEVRNPLTSIKTFIQLAPIRVGNQDFLQKFGKVVTDDIARIERLTQEILDYSQRTSVKVRLENLNEILDACLNAIRLKTDDKMIDLVKELDPDLPQIPLDRQQIHQVFLNILFNAFEALSEQGGRLIVRSQYVSQPYGEPLAHVEVEDNGSGIPPNELPHIFDPFFTTKHESREREGTGLGLTIAHQIILAHGGTVEVTSEIGKGTTFFINFPTIPKHESSEVNLTSKSSG